MLTFLKKELHTYAVTMIGAVSAAILLALAGFVTRYVNYYNGYASYGYTLQNVSFWFYMIAVPLLTMRTFAEEYRMKTDLLWVTAPVRTAQVVLGKYAALLIFLLIPTVIMNIYAAVLGTHGVMPVSTDRTAFLLFFLMGSAYFSMGMFFSSLTENQIIAAVLSVLFVFTTQLSGRLRTVISVSQTGGLIFILILIAAVCLAVLAGTRKLYFSIVLLLAGEAAAIALFLINRSWYDGRISEIISIFDFRSMFFTGVMGTLDARAILYFLSYAAAGILLTVFSIARRSRPAMVSGTALLAVLLLNIFFLNLIAWQLPAARLVKDVTPNALYTVGEETKAKAAALTQDVHLFFLTAYGEEDRDLEALLAVYDDLSDHISAEKIDLVAMPRFPERFGEKSLPYNSVIAESGGRSKILRYEVFYPTEEGNQYATAFDGEGQLTGAVEAVTDPRIVTVYRTKGHGEPQFDTAMSDSAAKLNLETADINLLAEEIPGEDSILAIFAPSSDFTEAETAKIRAYLENGGRVFVTTLNTTRELPCLNALLAEYGMESVPGYVLETEASAYMQMPYLLFPTIIGNSEVTYDFPQENLLYAFAQGIKLKDSENAVVRPLLYSGNGSFARTDLSIPEGNRRENEEEGPFALAAEASVRSGTENAGILLYFTTPCAFSSSILSQFLQQETALPSGNGVLFTRSFAYLAGKDAAGVIPPKSMTTGRIFLPEGAARTFGIVAMIILPGLFLLAGAAVWLIRRKR